MNKQYFVVDLGHSIHGRVKRIHISHQALLWFAGAALLTLLLAFGLFSSYLRMTWKIANYNAMRNDFDHLRQRYQRLQKESKQQTEQVANLQLLASEVSVAYGLNPPPAADELAAANPLSPSYKESLQQYNFLASANSSSLLLHRYPKLFQKNVEPSLWPVNGMMRSTFGERLDPFSGEGTFHTGVDLQAVPGTPVHVTADGVVAKTEWNSSYGKLLEVDHGGGLQTWYAHLSTYYVVPGQAVRRGEVVALSGGTGRVTSPHLHYEVRQGGTPINPYRFLAKSSMAAPEGPAHSDLGF
jgi:murein DD-endopeptidase MepM/ murein hydrolase activator NlpD